MGAIHSHQTQYARYVLAIAPGVAKPYVPTGWLAMLRREFLQRDVSIRNTLMLDPSVTMKPFEVRPVGQLMTRLSLEYEGELAKYVDLPEGAIEKVGSPGECRGFIIDGDMAARLEDYFKPCETGSSCPTACCSRGRSRYPVCSRQPMISSPFTTRRSGQPPSMMVRVDEGTMGPRSNGCGRS